MRALLDDRHRRHVRGRDHRWRVALGAYLFHAGAITLGTVYLVFQYTEMLREPLEQLTRQMQDLQQATAGIVRIRELLGDRSQIVDGPARALPPGPLGGRVRRRLVRLRRATPGVLEDVPSSSRPASVLGLLGRTGSGKTT